MARRPKYDNIIKKLKKEQTALGKTRDRLNNLLDDIEEEHETAKTAFEDLGRVIDLLSEMH